MEPFSDNPIMLGYDTALFEFDESRGFKFREDRLITEFGFQSLDEIILSIRANPRKLTILNLGDSSTSGWNSEMISSDNVLSPFFTYRTYSDILSIFNSINAGIPGYSSLQGKRYLEVLLRNLGHKRIKPDVVTAYFGNNDGVFNGCEDKVRIDFKSPSKNTTGLRVSLEDFETNMINILRIARDYEIMPIFLIPPVRYLWEPGIRSISRKAESLEAMKTLDNSTKEKIQRAELFYQRRKYKDALEEDELLPRLKQKYRKKICSVARRYHVPVIDVQSYIPNPTSKNASDVLKYFADYCHPLEPLNWLIAKQVVEILRRYHNFDKPTQRMITEEFLPQRNIYTLS